MAKTLSRSRPNIFSNILVFVFTLQMRFGSGLLVINSVVHKNDDRSEPVPD